jgi:hypothetical protein
MDSGPHQYFSRRPAPARQPPAGVTYSFRRWAIAFIGTEVTLPTAEALAAHLLEFARLHREPIHVECRRGGEPWRTPTTLEMAPVYAEMARLQELEGTPTWLAARESSPPPPEPDLGL